MKIQRQNIYAILIILAITFAAFYNAIDNDFVNYDDKNYLHENPLVKDLSMQGFKNIFTQYYLGNYHPLTILSYAVEYHFVKLNPKVFHLANIILHLLNTVLVFLFIYCLTTKREIAFITSLLFGIHPMHVESVAWISERKDLLYTFFYMASLIFYLFFIQKERNKLQWYLISFFLFIPSVLSKAMAVTLPMVLLLIDYYSERKFSRKIILEKIPFLIVSLFFGIIAFFAQHAAQALVGIGQYSFFERIFLACYSLLIYLSKFFIPVNLKCFYDFPIKTNGILPLMVYFSPVIILANFFLMYKFFRKNKGVVFGMFFFLINIILVLQIIGVGQALLSERFSYISYIGLFFLLGFVYDFFKVKKPQFVLQININLIIFTALLFYATYERNTIWKNSEVLWSDVILKNPSSVTAYYGRGIYYSKESETEKAIREFNIALSLDPNNDLVLSTRGVSYAILGENDLAFSDFNHAIGINPKKSEHYVNRGRIFHSRNDIEAALADFSYAIQLNTNNPEAYFRRSLLYDDMHNYSLALRDAVKAKQLGWNVEDVYLEKLNFLLHKVI